MQRKLCLTLLVLLGAMTYLPRGRAQRSGYVPMALNIPGLLPRFGEVEDNNTPSGSSGQRAPSTPSGGNTLGTRLGVDTGDRRGAAERLPRPTVNQVRCPTQQVPCFDCVVYISRSGQITRFSPDQGAGR